MELPAVLNCAGDCHWWQTCSERRIVNHNTQGSLNDIVEGVLLIEAMV